MRARPSASGGSARAGTPHALDVVWVERWGESRRSCVLVQHAKGAPLPSERAVWGELSKLLNGPLGREQL